MPRSLALVQESPAHRRLLPRLLATVALAALALAVLRGDADLRSARLAMLSEVRESGVDAKSYRDFAAGAFRETDRARIEIEAARLLLNREIDRPAPWAIPETRERFGRVLELAREAGGELPALSRAYSVYASALVQLRTRTADTRLFSQHRQWELPLEHAIALDPADLFAKQTLSYMYLEVWPAIAPEKRPQVEALLRAAFLDQRTFNGLAAKWFVIAGSLDAAAELVPDRPWAWQAFTQHAANLSDWPAYIRYQERYRRAVGEATDAAIATAEARAAAGDLGGARQLLDEAFARLPLDVSSAARAERVLALRPAGPASRNVAQTAARWLDWLEPLALLGRSPLSGDAVGRLAFLAAGDISPEKAAFASLAAGDLGRGELFERRSDALWSERWAPYLTLKARLLLTRGDAAAARATLERAHRDFHPRLAWTVLAQSVGLPPPRTAAGTLRVRGPASSWDSTDWFWKEGVARLELLPERAASGLAIDLSKVPPTGGALELLWDGVPVGPVPLAAQAEGRVVIDLEVSREPHLLELRPVGSRLPQTARVALR